MFRCARSWKLHICDDGRRLLRYHATLDIRSLVSRLVPLIDFPLLDFVGQRFLTFSTESRKFNVQIKVPVGELVKPTTMHETEFIKQQGNGVCLPGLERLDSDFQSHHV